MNTVAACRAHLAKLPPAVSGQRGHDATLRAACECVRFGLSDGDALALLREWNGTHCQPPWKEKDLAHKLKDARRKASVRTFTQPQPRPAVRVVWKITRKTPAPITPTPTAPPPQPAGFCPAFWIVRPGLPIPSQFVDVLRTWKVFRLHPAWRDHPQLNTP